MRAHAREMAVGLALGLGGVALAAALTDAERLVFVGVLLGAVGAVYLGFAIADGRPSAVAVQSVGASCFALIAYLGVTHDTETLLGVGWLAHAAWDAAHHEGRGPTRVRTWYPPFCAVADLVIGVTLVAGWL